MHHGSLEWKIYLKLLHLRDECPVSYLIFNNLNLIFFLLYFLLKRKLSCKSAKLQDGLTICLSLFSAQNSSFLRDIFSFSWYRQASFLYSAQFDKQFYLPFFFAVLDMVGIPQNITHYQKWPILTASSSADSNFSNALRKIKYGNGS